MAISMILTKKIPSGGDWVSTGLTQVAQISDTPGTTRKKPPGVPGTATWASLKRLTGYTKILLGLRRFPIVQESVKALRKNQVCWWLPNAMCAVSVTERRPAESRAAHAGRNLLPRTLPALGAPPRMDSMTAWWKAWRCRSSCWLAMESWTSGRLEGYSGCIWRPA